MGDRRRRKRDSRAWAAALVLLGLVMASTGSAREPAPEPPPGEEVRGVVISTHRSGQEWASDAIVPAFREVAGLGANWVCTHPYAFIGADGSIRYRRGEEGPHEEWVRPIREAHALGLKILIKPHIGYWGSPFSWRGEIAFDGEEKWTRFWTQYRAWILDLAEACSEADGFAVGTELDKTLDHENRWREIIREVRDRTDAPLTYAANWTDYHRVPFWDALDVVGVQAYFPLADTPNPPESRLREGWKQRMTELRTFAARHHRNVLFTEVGYSRSVHAPVRPWEGGVEGEEAAAIQETCLRIALEETRREPWVVGLFLWKWFTPPHSAGRNYRLATPELKKVISTAWGK